ncbi:hypothetical protein K469DRAFT_683682 [Zopfia rhizophila CBS 207.26]|uniref:ATPase AAA-type core domain-containing protein n=1 Tax=Zopfia rhizophila CBS 207.26 TaxID=1314779 RepID=A0A6A6EEJ6_9PEZI|nr:hypothetical protein K469DRAFT_683682 [Zopfia rhizophila CBS 207.26]
MGRYSSFMGSRVEGIHTRLCALQNKSAVHFSISIADLGVNHVDLERELTRWLKVAKSWGVMMLLDEADIYIEYRQIHDLERNNLVACFLRAIGYYESKEFTDEDRNKIRDNHFSKINEEAGDHIVPTVVTLAQADAFLDRRSQVTIKREYIKEIVDISKECKDYMQSVHRKNESQ